MALLFDRDEKTIRKHIDNVFVKEEDEKENNTQKKCVDGVKRKAPFYTLDVINSVGYRVKSKKGVEFRKWTNSVLKHYIIQGYAVNNNRINQLGEVIRIMKQTEDSLDGKQVLSVIKKYNLALDQKRMFDMQNIRFLNFGINDKISGRGDKVSQSKCYVYIIITGCLWGIIGCFVKILENLGSSAAYSAFLRMFLGFVVLFIYCVLREGYQAFEVSKKTMISCMMIGIFSQGLYNLTYNFANSGSSERVFR